MTRKIVFSFIAGPNLDDYVNGASFILIAGLSVGICFSYNMFDFVITLFWGCNLNE